jgi:Flp pilus assembly protein TadG
MRAIFRSRKSQSGATIILLMAMMPLFLIPLVGLGIDATRLYVVQAKLSAAVDGAALGSGRLLGTPANTTEIAEEFLHVNFPTGYWATTNWDENVTYTNNLGRQTITVDASVDVPLTFIRVLGHSSSHIRASAVATRAVTRVVMVLDRSGSMNATDPATGKNVFETMRGGAEWFASRFTPNYDELGLVIFSGSGIVAYPMGRPYNPDPMSSGGPDKTFATDPQHQVGPIFDQLNAMGAGGGTNMSEALTLAYYEMQKAHYRDLARDGSDNTLNTIVLFTDGVPSGVSVYVNDYAPGANALKAPGSTYCTYNPATTQASTQMRGWIAAPGQPPSSTNPFPGWGTSQGLYLTGAFDTSHTLAWWVGSSGAQDLSKAIPTSAVTNCTYLYGGSGGAKLNDMGKLPLKDRYGNVINSTAYLNARMTNGRQTWSPNTGAASFTTSPTRGYDVAAACWNATDAIGQTIRSQTAMNQITIFTIGYTGSSPGTDIGLLTRLANAPNSSSFDSRQPIGKFYQVNDTNQLSAAFDAVASSLLRLAQ